MLSEKTITYDGSVMKLYYDGEVKVETAAIGKIDENDVPVSIGRNSEGNREHCIGLIDDVAIWNVALSDDEVQQAMDRVFAVEAADKLPIRWAALKNDYTKK